METAISIDASALSRGLTLVERAQCYSREFPDYPPLRADSRWLDGMWVMGNNYKGSGYYGSYPPTYLKRIMALFPDKKSVLHLFSGSLPPGEYTRFDINPELGDVAGEAERLSEYFPDEGFDLILADPPYSEQDAKKYGVPLVNRNKVVKECAKLLINGGHLVWMDQVLPMFRKDTLHLCGLIGIVRSTNHRFRVVSIFERRVMRLKDRLGIA